ncbi:MAG: hypothetical protein IT287_02335, partial [Bdellovibrionaceae bacterium]|nr:hypothetical protein [Pseudobdellovibrionaceae bacterium]
MTLRKPWLKSAPFDLSFILLPSLFSVLFAFYFSTTSEDSSSLPLWAWLLFVLAIDVSHVYSTLFRTYFNSNEWAENKT